MSARDLQQPLTFRPLFKERVWGGRLLQTTYGKALPPEVRIGESWEIVDRPEAQSMVAGGPFHGESLHQLWSQHRAEIFGATAESERFPLLIKLLDAHDNLSLQVHPAAGIAAEMGGEPKSEFWYIAAATPNAELYVGLKKDVSKQAFREALEAGSVAAHCHRIEVRAGDAMFLPSGRMHAIGAGNLIFEIQQNSDTTYRVFDWNRTGTDGKPRTLHIEESLRAIDFEDFEPELIAPDGEILVKDRLFQIEKWELDASRHLGAPEKFVIIACLTGAIHCAGVTINPGELMLVPASLRDRELRPRADASSLLRVTIPPSDATL